MLTEEDKNWIAALMEASEQRAGNWISEQIEASEQRTKKWVSALLEASEQRTKKWVSALLEASEQRTKEWVSALLEASEQRTAAKIERSETALLTAFHQWASPLETRVRSHSLAIRAFDQEGETSIDRDRKVADLEARVRKLEKAS